jgi:hypothetical protein
MGMERTAIWLPTWMLAALTGCGSDVFVIDGERHGTPCFPEVHIAPGQQEVDLRVASPGTFVGEHLHLDAIVDGERRYVVLQIDAGTAFVVGEPAIEGPAKLAHLGQNLYARAANEAEAVTGLDVIDTSEPFAPVVAAHHAVAGAMPAQLDGALGADAGHAYFCHSKNEVEADLVSLDLTDPLEAGAPVPINEFACNLYFEHTTSVGPVWVSWIPGGGDLAGSIHSFELEPTSAAGGVDFGYATNGIHNYGPAERTATDGRRIVVDAASNSWILLFDEHGNHGFDGPYHTFPLGGPKRLLAVYDALAYFATTDGIHALDVSDVGAPAMIDFVADTGVALDELSLVAVGRTYLAVADGDGRLYLVDRSRSGPVPPARAFLGPPAETASHPGGC